MLAPGKHYVNSPIRLTVNLIDDAGNDTDPTTVLIKILDPFGISTTYTYGTGSEVTKQSVGDYAADITPDSSGRWRFRWETTGGVIALEGDFLVQDSAFYPWDGNLTDYVP
jgi:hypothetical protein